ncbi:hypothetical protein BC834DRAFT_373704 [Gloeopeniophorella convolvens]|nr:hypothetical protein BC834DRAFT_373704 [Gloeopeniophorella convolvens]
MQGTLLEEGSHRSRCLSCFSTNLTPLFRFGPLLRCLHGSSASRNSGHLSTAESDRSVFSPISTLPSDALVFLFHSCKDNFISSVRHTLSEDDPYMQTEGPTLAPISARTLPSWIACSHVCRRWRDIILHTPSLWADIVLDTGPIWTTQSLIRSGLVHEIRFFGQLSSAFDGFFEKQLSHPVDLSRLSLISISAPPPLLVQFLSRLPRNAPTLRTVEIGVSPSPGLVGTVPPDLLIRNSPHIDRIVIRSLAMIWNPPQTPTRVLTHLEINISIYSSPVANQLSKIEDAVDFIRGTPALEVLSLSGCFIALRDAAGSISVKAELPHLRTLVIDGSAPAIMYFLNHVSIPSASRVQLHFTLLWPGQDPPILAISFVFRRFSARPRSHAATGVLALLWNSGTGFQLLASSTVPANFHTLRTGDHFPEVDVDLRFDRGPDPGNKSQLFLAACNELPPGFVHTLAVQGPDDLMLWGQLATRFPHITHIMCLDIPAARSLCSWLQEASTSSGGELPALQRLTMASRVHAHLLEAHDIVQRVLLSLLQKAWGSVAPSAQLYVSSTIDGNWVEAVGEVADHASELLSIG